ncbi:MAG: NAD(P)-dependent dehydrogenase (short-subunit alcohol dehydrogenase family) [Arcticibacterium sp.]
MLKNKVIVIIGGTAGIGLAAAEAFVAAGAKVVALGNRPEDEKVAAELLGNNGKVLTADATEEGSATLAIQTAVEYFGTLDGLYHVAGGSGRKYGDGPLAAVSKVGWERTLDLNLTSVMLSNQAAIQWFIKNKKKGAILNLGSVLGTNPSPKYFGTIAYATAKAGLIGMSKAAAAYYAADNIKINVLAPGLVDTPMSRRASDNENIQHFIKSKQALDGGRNGGTEDLIGAALYFLSDYAKFTTGQVLNVCGGWELNDGQILN